MNTLEIMFLEALKASLENKKVNWNMEISPKDWSDIFNLAEIHHILPMIYEAVYDCPSAKAEEEDFFSIYRRRVVQQVMQQAMKSNEFLSLYQHLRESGVEPLVVKGIVCRNLYPKPDCRISGDEDLLISAEQFGKCHQAMKDYGMRVLKPNQDLDEAYEVPYGKEGSPVYIELHKSLFPKQSDAYGGFNRFFERAQEQAVDLELKEGSIRTLNETDHFFYLICHAFKHFLHSGFGIRQVCDIVLFANKYGRRIDWDQVLRQCQEIHAEQFTVALLRIGEKYLTFSFEEACCLTAWRELAVDEVPLLKDLLGAGVYGDANMSRKHSSNITLHAVATQKKGKESRRSVLGAVFPAAERIEGRYPYLKKHPYLLPIAWFDRIFKYRKEIRQLANNDVASAIQIGNERIELMKQYGIIK